MGVLLFSLPAWAQKMQTVEGYGRYVSRSLKNLPAFNAVEVRGDAEVDFMQSEEVAVTVSGRENLVSFADVRVEEGVLVVGFTRPIHIRGEHHLRVAVSAPDLTKVSVSQGGEFEVRGSLQTQDLKLSALQDSEISIDYLQAHSVEAVASGRAEVELNRIHTQRLNATVSDRADMDFAGETQDAVLVNNGSGEIDADDLRATFAYVTNNASGKIKVNTSEALYAQANGRGRIEYRGYPSTLRKEGNARKVVRDRDEDYDDYDD